MRAGGDLGPNNSDVLAAFGVVIPPGPEPAAFIRPTPDAGPSRLDVDSDGDGVNDWCDKCPGSQVARPSVRTAARCRCRPTRKGVNFDLRTSRRCVRIAIADPHRGRDILKRYPDQRVPKRPATLDPLRHRCLRNQSSVTERQSRPRRRDDYLTSNGIDAGRLVGPNGYGESRPARADSRRPCRTVNEERKFNCRTELERPEPDRTPVPYMLWKPGSSAAASVLVWARGPGLCLSVHTRMRLPTLGPILHHGTTDMRGSRHLAAPLDPALPASRACGGDFGGRTHWRGAGFLPGNTLSWRRRWRAILAARLSVDDLGATGAVLSQALRRQPGRSTQVLVAAAPSGQLRHNIANAMPAGSVRVA